ncbi:hypothetical protein FD755_015741 [Muntiacus reevesi]|uniref:Uncharacterized protein n=1 Tax=Muntiacus reevesi TaxID=9886 RepID=A0A5N3XFU5_MUNRE|nr:hypothetical protein FD755_015741 [Muntiacus reevesi]
MSDSVRLHRWQPTRLPRPWDSPGKNTGVGCHFLFQCMKVKSESEVTQSCLTLSDPMDCSLPGSSVHGIFEARVLEWGWLVIIWFFLKKSILRRKVKIYKSCYIFFLPHGRQTVIKSMFLITKLFFFFTLELPFSLSMYNI